MSAVVNAAGETPSAWANFKNFFVEAGNWTGRQVVWMGGKIADFAVAVWQWAKPFFEAMGRFFAAMGTGIYNFVAEHQSHVILAVFALIAGMMIYGMAHAICCSDNIIPNDEQNGGGNPPANNAGGAAQNAQQPDPAQTGGTANPPADPADQNQNAA